MTVEEAQARIEDRVAEGTFVAHLWSWGDDEHTFLVSTDDEWFTLTRIGPRGGQYSEGRFTAEMVQTLARTMPRSYQT